MKVFITHYKLIIFVRAQIPMEHLTLG